MITVRTNGRHWSRHLLDRPGPLLVSIAVFFVPLAVFHVLDGFFWFDDEGTLMAGFWSLNRGLRMYDDIYSLYGPAYNALYSLIYVGLHVPLTHTDGRLIAAALSMIYTAGFAGVCYRLTRSTAAMLICFLLETIRLAQLMQSPGHPEEISLVLLSAFLLLACAIEHRRGVATFVGLGAVAALLALIKINLGVYVGCAAVFVLLRATVPAAWTRIAAAATAAVLLLLPAAVEASIADFAWVRHYIVFSTLVVGAALAAFPAIPATVRRQDWFAMAAAAGAAFCIVILETIANGSSAFAILNAVLLQNTHFLRNWYLPLHSGAAGISVATASAIAAFGYRLSRSRPTWRGYGDIGALVLKGVVVIAGTVLFLFPVERFFAVLTPFCWLLLVPLPDIRDRQTTARAMVGMVGAIMSLYPFPVAGHQVNIGSLIPTLAIPVLACDLLAFADRHSTIRSVPAGRSTFFALLAVITAGTVLTIRTVREYWLDRPLGLPGTTWIHADPHQAADLIWVTEQLSRCKSSYSLPGMFSFSFWAGQPLPTGQNVNDTLAFIRPEQQAAIVQTLAAEPDLCIVYNPDALAFFDRGQIATDPPLLHFVKSSFTPVAQRDGYFILRLRTPPSATAQ